MCFVAPQTFDRDVRLEQVERVFTLLHPVCRPLELQAEFCLRDEYGLPELGGGAQIARAAMFPEHVYPRPTLAGPIPTSAHTDLSPSGIREWLRSTRPADTDAHTGDWETLVTLATEVRAFVDGPTLHFEEFPQPVESHGYGSETWFAGPPGDRYYRSNMPAMIQLVNAPDRIGLEIWQHWEFVEPNGRPEEASFDGVFSELVRAGFG